MSAVLNMISPKTIERVAPARIHEVWAAVAPMLNKAIEREKTHDIEDIRKLLLAGSATLWMIDGGAAVVTQFVSYPKGVWLRLWAAAAEKGAAIDWMAARADMEEFARRNGCKGMEIVGRGGWFKIYPDAECLGLWLRSSL